MSVLNGGKPAANLCLKCGLCCNGVIFADVRLQAGDDPVALRNLGLHTSRGKFSQPCTAFDGCRCRVYSDRPNYCRKFECLLLQSVQNHRIEPAAALRVIRTARRQVDRVNHLLKALGDTDEHLPVRTRFKRTSRRFEDIGSDEATAKTYAELTLAMQDLSLLLSEKFYS